MAADIRRDVMLPEFLLHQFHRGENRPFGTARAEPRRPGGNHAGQSAHRFLVQHGGGVGARGQFNRQANRG